MKNLIKCLAKIKKKIKSTQGPPSKLLDQVILIGHHSIQLPNLTSTKWAMHWLERVEDPQSCPTTKREVEKKWKIQMSHKANM